MNPRPAHYKCAALPLSHSSKSSGTAHRPLSRPFYRAGRRPVRQKSSGPKPAGFIIANPRPGVKRFGPIPADIRPVSENPFKCRERGGHFSPPPWFPGPVPPDSPICACKLPGPTPPGKPDRPPPRWNG